MCAAILIERIGRPAHIPACWDVCAILRASQDQESFRRGECNREASLRLLNPITSRGRMGHSATTVEGCTRKTRTHRCRPPGPRNQIQFVRSERILDLLFCLGEPTIFIWIVSFPMTSRKATRRSRRLENFFCSRKWRTLTYITALINSEVLSSTN